MKPTASLERQKKWTNLAEKISKVLEEDIRKPVVSDHEIFRIIWQAYKERSVPYLRGPHPSHQTFSRTKSMLFEAGIIRRDYSYSGLWRIMTVPDEAADVLCCQVDRFCYISHMSAMQRYGLTNRRPEALFLTRPTDVIMRSEVKREFQEYFNVESLQEDIFLDKPYVINHPSRVRKRKIEQLKTKLFGEYTRVRGTDVRISSIGQVFLDMLNHPERCGGMRHVIEVWKNHAPIYFDRIVRAVDQSDRPIVKVRAGYILDEILNIATDRVLSWQSHAARGGSRVLEAGREYQAPFSEKWMLSVNV